MSKSVPVKSVRAKSDNYRSSWILAATFVVCAFEIVWFWRFCGHNITADAVSYIGLARHLRDGDFIQSLHGYWSPLISWLIATVTTFFSDWTLAGRLVTVATLLALFPLLYVLSYRLWESRLSAAIATLWFALARGVIAMSVCSILADFLLAGIVCVYFILLLRSLRQDRSRDWFLLGAAHAAAFLAKAIALPWLAITTLLAAILTRRKSIPQMVSAIVLALTLPAIAWLSYGSLLKLKYGYFTAGYQLRYNLIVDSRRHLGPPDPYVFADTSKVYDRYLVTEVSQSEVRAFHVLNPSLLPILLSNELRNLPEAIKQTVILLTPGGVLGLAIALWRLVRHRGLFLIEFRFALLVIISSVTLLLAYCMLVFDARYVLPLILPLTAMGSLALAPAADKFKPLDPGPSVRKILLVLLAAGAVFFQIYWASPFRTITRDFEIHCYNAARALKDRQPDGTTLISVGEGPFPIHGVGSEAGNYTAYFAGRRIIGYNVALPDLPVIPALAAQISERNADAVLVWGSPTSDRYRLLLETLDRQLPQPSGSPIIDPEKGEVGRLLFPATPK